MLYNPHTSGVYPVRLFDFLSDLIVESYWLEPDVAMLGSSFCGRPAHFFGDRQGHVEFLHSPGPQTTAFLDDFRKGGLAA